MLRDYDVWVLFCFVFCIISVVSEYVTSAETALPWKRSRAGQQYRHLFVCFLNARALSVSTSTVIRVYCECSSAAAPISSTVFLDSLCHQGSAGGSSKDVTSSGFDLPLHKQKLT